MPDSGVAGSTFRAGKVDVAVTWEPWLSRANKRPHGHVLISSKVYPNIIVDVFGFRSDFLKAHPDVVRRFAKAYYAAVAEVDAGNPAAMAAIEKYTGENLASVKSDLQVVKLMDLKDSKAYFGTPAKPGPIYDIARKSADFWLSIKKIDKLPNINALIDSSYQ
jgi:NitT/TauT family transport system substrate-binding protein